MSKRKPRKVWVIVDKKGKPVEGNKTSIEVFRLKRHAEFMLTWRTPPDKVWNIERMELK